MSEEVGMSGVGKLIGLLEEKDEDRLKDIFAKRIYSSFFLFDPPSTGCDSEDLMNALLNKENQTAILDITSMFKSELAAQGIEVGFAWTFPFIKVSHNPFSDIITNTHDPISPILVNFEGTFFRYLCVMNVEGKVVIFTDITEDFFEDRIAAIESLGYRKIELHNVIPRIIDSLSEKFADGDAEINELGVSFPLSMLGSHAQIMNRMKSGSRVGSDANFKNLIRYGLLDHVQIHSDFKISFNADREKDKYCLQGFLYSGGSPNCRLFKELKYFIQEINKAVPGVETKNFADLPIYVIAGKRGYKSKAAYPTFSISKTNGKSDLILDFNDSDQEKWLGENMEGRYLITGIYPQYLKEVKNRDGRDAYAYLSARLDGIAENLTMEDVEGFFIGRPSSIRCDTFLKYVKDKVSEGYRYVNRDEPDSAPNLMPSDLILTAIRPYEVDGPDFLITIVDPKKGNRAETPEKEKKVTASLYKLSSFEFDERRIAGIIESYHAGQYGNRIKDLGLIEKFEWCPKEENRFQVNGKTFCKIGKLVSGKNALIGYSAPEKFKNKPYVDSHVKLEDLWSMSFMELLEGMGHTVFFGGRKNTGPGSKRRELADVISIRSLGDGIEINLFHMKLPPFEQKSEGHIGAAFSHYTEVVGQVLEKLRPLLYANSPDSIVRGLSDFFPIISTEREASEIYNALESAIQKNANRKICLNVLFPIKEKDYFDKDSINGGIPGKLGIVTNWKRLKVLAEVFDSNINSVSDSNPRMSVKLHLGVVICKKEDRLKLDKYIGTRCAIWNDIGQILN